MADATSPSPLPAAPRSRGALGIIWLTIFIDLLGFTIIFPLFPALLRYYLQTDGNSGLLGALISGIDHLGRLAGAHDNYRDVLFGGVLGSLFGLLQFIFSPLWGSLSDRIGRARVLKFTVAGTAFSYLLWFVSGSFGIFVLSRVLAGAFGGNLSVATAAVADVTSRQDRAKGMALIGIAFGLGFVFGPAIGSMASRHHLELSHPSWAAWGVNPFSCAALIALILSVINLIWIFWRFRETLDPEHRDALPARIRHPLHELLAAEPGPARRSSSLYFIYQLAFAGMEISLPFLAEHRFHYGPEQMEWIFIFLGTVLLLTQGGIVRTAVPRFGEKRVLIAGLVFVLAGMVLVGLAPSIFILYCGLAALGLGSGLTNPTVSALVSLYSPSQQQGRMLGVFRSLGSLARGVAPVAACLLYWLKGASAPFLVGAVVLLLPCFMALPLPRPAK